MLSWTLGTLALLAVACGALRLWLVEPEVPAESLAARYGRPPFRFLTLPSGTLARYLDVPPGRGAPTIVMLHGGNLSIESFDPWIARLEGAARIIALDLPGHGLTGATREGRYDVPGFVDFVQAFTDALDLKAPFVLVGHSTGGHAAWRFALAHPEKVGKLVLVAPGGVAPPSGSQAAAIKIANLPGGAFVLPLLLSRARFEAGLKANMRRASAVTPELVDRAWAMSRRAGTPEASIARLRAPSVDPPSLARLAELKMPALILWGREDVVFPLSQSEVFLNAMPAARLVAFDGCGHFPIEEAPDATFAAFSAFLAIGE